MKTKFGRLRSSKPNVQSLPKTIDLEVFEVHYFTTYAVNGQTFKTEKVRLEDYASGPKKIKRGEK
jgi:ABC-type uncharacterized transport system substrate-binding protein